MKKIVIIGAGPTGLGAAYRLKELGYENFTVYERNTYAGGLCASFKDNKGFTWDLGGHVIFSHYEYFDKLFAYLLGSDYLQHRREAWIRIMDRWIPYPFQNNIKYLPEDVAAKCLESLKKVNREKSVCSNFQEWIVNNMGKGIAEYFMLPYNLKVWAHPLDILSSDWIDERVSKVDSKDAVALLVSGRDKVDWGPNVLFKFPLFGGTGEVFRRMARLLGERVIFNSELLKVDAINKKIYLSDNRIEAYDVLINTSPLDRFIKLIEGYKEDLLKSSSTLKHNGVFVVGIGINKPSPSNYSWMYFPGDNCPFFRVTYFSNYSPNNSPDNKKYYSLLCETAYSEYRKVSKSEITDMSIQGLINSGLLKKSDRALIVANFLFDIDYAYPIPTLDRNNALQHIQPILEKMDIYSRGRFGAWKYEIANTDHSVMQGKEVVDRILKKDKEYVWCL
ncbi:MAG: NAD(P)-binding protein [Deltaproteobacteria bacterium]|nr:NAD(P)-binding protein [Deltaproteobacteria bacterium]